jgi:xanthine dehydrogenase YagS FAD-binding subunit
MHPFEHTTAASAEEALALLGQQPGPGTQLIAGGTDLLPLMNEGLASPARLIDIKPVRALRYLRFDPDGTLRIGALTTLTDLERDAAVAERLPLLQQAVRDAATPQLRAVATVGGNLVQQNRCWYYRGPYECWLKGGEECFARGGQDRYHAIHLHGPCVAVHPSDLAPALVALDAMVKIAGPRRGSRTIPVEQLLVPPTADRRSLHQLGPGELITEITVPAQPQGARGVYLKAMDRAAWAFALVSAAVQLTIAKGRVERARLVLGGVANVPWRVSAAEGLRGQALTPERAAQVAESAVAGATPLPHNQFKVPLARELARRALLGAAGLDW